MACSWGGLTLSLGDTRALPEGLQHALENGSNSDFLCTLADLALVPTWSEVVFSKFEALFVEICNIWIARLENGCSALDVVATLARILPVAPHLRVYAEHIACKSKAGRFAVLFSSDSTALCDLPEQDLLFLLRVLLRLVQFDDHTFGCLVSLSQLRVLLEHRSPCVKYLSLRLICIFLRFSDTILPQRIDHSQDLRGQWDDQPIDYRFISLWEEKRLSQLQQSLNQAANAEKLLGTSVRRIQECDLSAGTVCLAGVLVPSPGLRVSSPSLSSSFVMTPTTTTNLRNVAVTLNSSRPILLTGVMGCGKTSIARFLALKANRLQDMITLHLNDQTDAKSLIGMYTSGDEPGSFKWQPGVLTKAVVEGRWVFIENLDRASTEVISTLLPLLERKELLVSHLGGWVRASSGFQLIATIRSTLNSRGQEIDYAASMLGYRHWQKVLIQKLTDNDLGDIIRTRYPVLVAYEDTIMRIYRALLDEDVKQTNKSEIMNTISTQHLMRFCYRVANLLTKLGLESSSDPVPETTVENIFLEAVDCFLALHNAHQMKISLAKIISNRLSISDERLRYCLTSRVPAFNKNADAITVGRVSLKKAAYPKKRATHGNPRPFAVTNHTVRYMESIASAVDAREPCLLVGETGTGKTTIVQELANALGHNLTVVNLSHQSEASDLIGGFKPINARALAIPLQDEFQDLFEKTASSSKNEKFMKSLERSIQKNDWERTIKLWQDAISKMQAIFATSQSKNENPTKKRRIDSPKYQPLKGLWADFALKVESFKRYSSRGSKDVAFSFVEGNIVKAVRSGGWVLLDEINLASPDTLETIADLFVDGTDGVPSLLLTETGELQRLDAHPDFRIFGAMNPATDVGKRDLPPSLRGRFTEYFIASPDHDQDSLEQIIKKYLGTFVYDDLNAPSNIANLYREIRSCEQHNILVDGAEQKPHFSLRTLTRTLNYASDMTPTCGLRRSLVEGFSMSFLTFLDAKSSSLVSGLIDKHILKGHDHVRRSMKSHTKPPSAQGSFVRFHHYWMPLGPHPVEVQPQYIMTPFVEKNLFNLVRATSTRRFPILLQGPTSSGKTSMVEYLAKFSGNRFLRINNHEHTDLQEYIGTYVSGPEGLYYQEGILVRALREGHWVVLDELNLAPTDVLEALNRLLDDNRELLIPETQEVVRPHANFMLFATQNPPGLYGGRKVLSRAFRNRFLELHFDDIPESELETILVKRTQIAPQFGHKIVKVYQRLASLRQSSRVFEHKNSFATLRDLFRWAQRDASTKEELAVNGYYLLAERVRDLEERAAVKSVIEDVMRVKLSPELLYGVSSVMKIVGYENIVRNSNIVWTYSTRRLFILLYQAILRKEPVLLVGGTGIGKTSICQVLAEVVGTELHILNAHQNTETGDLVGSQRPLRNRSEIEDQLYSALCNFLQELEPLRDIQGLSLEAVIDIYESLPNEKLHQSPQSVSNISALRQKLNTLFEWCDGNLVSAMRTGAHFLLDEISLADDSVLERLNSVLEPERTLLLAEKGPEGAFVRASEEFRFLATMNPGGDYGKKELSPALRNRFTEIWVPNLSKKDILEIVRDKLSASLTNYAEPMIEFAEWFAIRFRDNTGLSLREMLSWVEFVNMPAAHNCYARLLHGSAMVYIDGLGANPSASRGIGQRAVDESRKLCLQKLDEVFTYDMTALYNRQAEISVTDKVISIGEFSLIRETDELTDHCAAFSMNAETTRENTSRIIRALQLNKPILVEGSPGVGKTTLIAQIAGIVGIPLTRINLSDQTDIMDLFGSDVPSEDGEAGHFKWSSAPFLLAMQRGDWVLLDEMNLASQSILEGLNACLDHRGEVYIPELDMTFQKHPRFRLFAAQNPHNQGGGRKGLPTSFVNRFTVVYADLLKSSDLLNICTKLYPQFSDGLICNMVQSVISLSETASEKNMLVKGGPWEFNLRDILRWLQSIGHNVGFLSESSFCDMWDLLFLNRLRDTEDVIRARLSLSVSSSSNRGSHTYFENITRKWYQCGYGVLPVNQLERPHPIGCSSRCWNGPNLLESAMISVQNGWPCLLVGASGSGKTAMVHHLASMVGSKLTELPLNTDTDTMDMIGGYEQVDNMRKRNNFIGRLKSTIKTALAETLADEKTKADSLWVLDKYRTFETLSLAKLKMFLKELTDLYGFERFRELNSELEELSKSSVDDSRARFEWTDGPLVESLRSGTWLVLDNANLCSPSVLDRLNSLLEPNGVLAINESRNSDGTVRIIKPHQNFRLFLTVNPRHGEVSRAMRNRCSELYFPDREDFERTDYHIPEDFRITRFKRLQGLNWSQVHLETFQSLALVAFESLSFSDAKDLVFWSNELRNGLLTFSSTQQQIWESVLWSFEQLCNSKSLILDRIQHAYKKLTQNAGLIQTDTQDFPLAQPLHPLFNSPLALSMAHDTNASSHIKWLGELLEQKLQLHLLEHRLREVIMATETRPKQNQSRLRRSILSHRHLIYKKDSTQPLSDFFKNFLDTCHRLSDDLVDLPIASSAFFILRETIVFLQGLFDISDALPFQEQHFIAHLSVGRSLSDRIRQDPYFTTIGEALGDAIGLFNTSWKLSTGTSMEILWSFLKLSTATSVEHLESILDFEKLASKLDNIIIKSNAKITNLSKLHEKLVEGYTMTVSSNKKFAIDGLKSILDEEQSRRVNHVDSRYRHFSSAFEGLAQYQNVSSNAETADSVLDTLIGRPTLQAFKSARFNVQGKFLFKLTKMTGILYEDTALMTIKQTLPVEILRKSLSIPNVPLGAIDTVREEIDELGRRVACLTAPIADQQLVSLSLSLFQVFSDILRCHEHLLEHNNLTPWYRYADEHKNHQSLVSLDFIAIKPNMAHNETALQFEAIANSRIIPSLIRIAEAIKSQSLTIAESAKAWIVFFSALLRSYVPDRIFDPSLTSLIRTDNWSRKLDQMKNKLNALRIFEKHATGCDSNYRCEVTRREIQETDKKPDRFSVSRPLRSRLMNLQSEFVSMFTSILAPIQDIGENNKTQNVVYGIDLQQIRENVKRMQERLSSHYREYDDIVEPASAMLVGLEIGISLLLIGNDESSIGFADNHFGNSASTQQILGLPANMLGSKHMTSSATLESSIKTTCLLLEHAILVANIEIMRGATVLPDEAHFYFESLFRSWKTRLEHDQKNHAARSSLYHYKGNIESEEIDLDELRQVFPDFDSDLETKTLATEFDAKDLAQTIAGLHRELFEQDITIEQKILNLTRHVSEHLAFTYEPSLYRTSPMLASSFLPSTILGFDEYRTRLNTISTNARTYNFYEDQNIGEMSKLLKLTDKIHLRFDILKLRWPEHATLDDVLRTISEIRAFRHSEPIAKVLTKVEKLHGYINEWQTVASSEFSAATLYTEVTDLIISWRRIELSTWSRLLDLEDERFVQDSRSWWFVAYEAIVIGSSSEDLDDANVALHVAQLLAELRNFLNSTCVAQYSARLQLIHKFSRHLLLIPLQSIAISTISSALKTFVNFYTRFEAAVKEHIQRARNAFEKDLKEIVLLASWKDTNINALRESSKRSHHKLFKVVRKYRNVLAGPVSHFLQEPSSVMEAVELTNSIVLNLNFSSDALTEALQVCETSIPGWRHGNPRYRDPVSTIEIIRRYGTVDTVFDPRLALCSFTDILSETIASLRKETPSTLTEENSSMIKHLKSRKRKLFAETLKELRQMGFRSNVDTQTLERQKDIPTILSRVNCDENLEGASQAIYNMLDYVDRIRQSSKGASDDLTSVDVSRSVGFFESILSNVLSQQSLLVRHIEELRVFDSTFSSFSNLWNPAVYDVKKCSLTISANTTTRKLTWLCGIIRASNKVIEAQARLGDLDMGLILGKLSKLANELEEFTGEFHRIPCLPSGFFTTLQVAMDAKLDALISSLCFELDELCKQFPEVEYILVHIKPWASESRPSIDTTSGQEPLERCTVEQVNTDAQNLLDMALVGMQKFGEASSDLGLTRKDPDWLKRSLLQYSKIMLSMRLPQLQQRLQGLTNNLRNTSTESDLMTSAAICATTVPIISYYRKVYTEMLKTHIDLHTVACRAGLILARSLSEILDHGFCSPKEKSTESGATDQLEEGTGLGDGEGAEDISKDVQDDEDLSELAQDSGTKDKRDLEKEDDAVDMGKDELNGAMDEAEGERDNEEGQDDDRENGASDDDFDSEVGSVDDLDPSAVDEKTWDAKSDEGKSEKNKESKKPKGQKSEEMTAGTDEIEDIQDDGEDDEADIGDSEEVRQDEAEQLDPRTSEEEKLDLPDDMNMDDAPKPEADSDDDIMDDISEMSMPEDIRDSEMERAESLGDSNIDDSSAKETEKDETTHPEDQNGEEDEAIMDTMNDQLDQKDDAEMDTNKDGLSKHDQLSVDNNESSGGNDATKTSDVNEHQPTDLANDESEQVENSDLNETNRVNTEGHNPSSKSMALERLQSEQQQQGEQDHENDKTQQFQKLGDALETWHRINSEIRDAMQNPEEIQESKIDPENDPSQEFQHLPDDEATADAQALGGATTEQAQILSEEALKSEKQQPHVLEDDDVEVIDMNDDNVPDHMAADDMDLDGNESQQPSHPSRIMGNDKRIDTEAQGLDYEETEMDNLDDNLSTVHLDSSDVEPIYTLEKAQRMWSHYEGLTRDLALSLTEQLRLILEPTVASRMRGDFRTGKRLNIKRIIPYIASQYKRDKIWMRRSVPSKRNYQIMLALDDSKSMRERECSKLALETLALVSKSLSMLEVGEICIVQFGSRVQVAHGFDQPFSPQAGADILRHFGFTQKSTDVKKLLENSLEIFRTARLRSPTHSADLWQLQLIISDGNCEDRDSIRKLLRKAKEERVMVVYVIVDGLSGQSIMDMQMAHFVTQASGELKAQVTRYLDDFPFEYFLIVGNVRDLPNVLALALRQWFAEVVDSA